MSESNHNDSSMISASFARLEAQLDKQRSDMYDYMLKSDARLNEMSTIVKSLQADRAALIQTVESLEKLANEGRGSIRTLIFVGSLISGLVAVLIAIRDYLP